jgi:Tol biopolymer transport system component
VSVSRNGTFVYRTGQLAQTYPIVWLESSAKTEPLLSKPGAYYSPRLSPDGRRLALHIRTGNGRDVFVYDGVRDFMARLTSDGNSADAVWTPDGKHLLYRDSNVAQDVYHLRLIRADGAGEPVTLLESKNVLVPTSFSPDRRRLLYFDIDPQTHQDLWTVLIDFSDADHPKAGKPEPFLRTPFFEYEPAFSPDGRWIAYNSGKSVEDTEIFVRPFPGPGGQYQVSTGGGRHPAWSSNGKQLFYETIPGLGSVPDSRIMVVDYVATADSFAPGKPRAWSDRPIISLFGASDASLAPDGKRFAVFPAPESGADNSSVHVTFLLNFLNELRRRLPPK